jgi:hypothetical protein
MLATLLHSHHNGRSNDSEAEESLTDEGTENDIPFTGQNTLRPIILSRFSHIPGPLSAKQVAWFYPSELAWLTIEEGVIPADPY